MADYKWAPGSRMAEKTMPAQIAGDALEDMQVENGGRLTARIVVDAARPIDAPLHPAFEWDDVKAAELHRESQARHLIAAIRIVQPRTDPKQKPQMIHAFVNIEEQVGDEKQRAYVPVARVFAEPDLLAQAVERAAAELRAFEDRYAEFDAIARAARAAREQIEKVAA
jgi:hypothetical protein